MKTRPIRSIKDLKPNDEILWDHQEPNKFIVRRRIQIRYSTTSSHWRPDSRTVEATIPLPSWLSKLLQSIMRRGKLAEHNRLSQAVHKVIANDIPS